MNGGVADRFGMNFFVLFPAKDTLLHDLEPSLPSNLSNLVELSP